MVVADPVSRLLSVTPCLYFSSFLGNVVKGSALNVMSFPDDYCATVIWLSCSVCEAAGVYWYGTTGLVGAVLLPSRSWLCISITHDCLSLAPVLYLGPAFSDFKFICRTFNKSKRANSWRSYALRNLLYSFWRCLYRARRLLPARTSTAFDNLCRFVRFARLWFVT